jgi:hypothetical protein
MEAEFHDVPGVLRVTSGYTGGTVKNPTYEQVSTGGTGHVEAIEIARHVERFRGTLEPIYDFVDYIVQHRAWNKAWYQQLQKDYPQDFGGMTYDAAMTTFQNSFKAEWPSLLEEPDSEKVKVDDTRLKAALATYQLLSATMDPQNKALLTNWLIDAVNQSDLLFASALSLDTEALADFAEQQQQLQNDTALMGAMPGGGGQGGEGEGGGKQQPMAGMPKLPSFKLVGNANQ